MQASPTSKALSFADREYATASADETHHNEEAAKLFTLPPYSYTVVIVKSPRAGLLIIKPKIPRFSGTSLQVAKEIFEVAPRQTFYVLLASLLKEQAFFA